MPKTLVLAMAFMLSLSAGLYANGTKQKEIHEMDPVNVIGSNETARSITIVGVPNVEFKPVRLSKSFADGLVENIDKEKNQRTYENALKPEL